MTARATLILLVAIACIYGSAEAQSRDVKSHTSTKPACKPAWLQLEKYDTYTGVVSTWHHAVVHARLKNYLHSRADLIAKKYPKQPGAVLIMPTNAAMNKWMHQYQFEPNAKRWNNHTIGHFKYVLKHMMVPWHTAHKRWPLYFTGCTLLGITHNVTHPLEGMKLDLWGGKGPGLEGSLRSLPSKSRSGAGRGLKSSKVQPQNYGIAGQGYNTLTGFPNSFSGGGVDPGFVGNAVFQVTPSLQQPQVTPVSKLPQGSCSTSFTSSTYSTASQLYSSSSTAIGASASYEGASFSANYNYNTMTQQSSTNQQSSFILSGTSSLGGYSINAAAGTLSPYYVTAVQNLCGAYSSGGPSSSMFQSQLETFAESYGSSYVKTFYYGGYAASVLQMSSSSYSSLQNQSVSLSAAASVTFIQSGGSVSGSYNGDLSVGQQVQSVSSTFQYIQIPSSALVALTSSGNIDCTSWTANLNQTANEGILAPMSYTVGSQQNILLGYPYLFGSPCTQSILSGVAAEMQTYFSSCSNSQVGCPPPGVCPTGSYAYVTNTTSGAFTCVYCYDQNNPQLSPMCNIQHTQSCGYQQCNCFSGYSSESQCNADSNPSPGGTCQTSFTGYGCATTNIVNQCTSGSNPVITYCSTTQVCSCQCCTKSGCSSVASSCPNPPPPPSSPPSSCFPASATVLVAGGRGSGTSGTYSKEMKDLRIGDRVLASRPDGSLFYDEIYMFGHKERSQRATFVRLETDSGHVLTLTPDHHVFVVRNNSHMEIPAGKAVVTDQVRVVPQSGALQHKHMSLQSIVSISLSEEKGLYNPYTLSGTIVVNGILASVHSSSAFDQLFNALGITLPFGYQTLFTPVRLLYTSLGAQKMASLEWIIDGAASVMNQPPHWVGHLIATLGISVFGFGLKRFLSGRK